MVPSLGDRSSCRSIDLSGSSGICYQTASSQGPHFQVPSTCDPSVTPFSRWLNFQKLIYFFCRLFFHKNEDSPQECLNSLRQRLRFLCTVSTFSSRWGSKNAFLCCTLVSNNSETHIPDMFVINMVPTFITHTHIHVALMCMHARIPL